MSRTIVLTGMPGAGKTTVGRLMAARLGRSFADVDEEIAKALQRPISQIIDEAGIEYFREVEHQMIRRLLRHNDIVVSLGGGAVLRDDNVAELLLTGVLVHLDVPLEMLTERLTSDPAEVAKRPLLAGDARTALAQLHLDRDHRYREVAEVVLDATGAPQDVVEVLAAWARRAGDVLTPSEHEVTM